MIHSKKLVVGNRAQKNNRAVDYQALEPRNLLASFVGTENADVVVVTFVAGVPQTIEINGDINNNPDATADIDLLGGADQISFLGTGIDLTVEAAVLTGEQSGSGSANGVFDFVFENRIAISTSLFADTVEITGGGLEGFGASLDTGEGDDVVTYHGGSADIELGSGDDHILFTVNFFDGLSFLGGGEGEDTWEFVDTNGRLEFREVDANGQAVFGFPCCFDGDPYGLRGYYGGIEKVVAPDPSTLELDSRVFPHIDRSGINDRGLEFHIDGNIATASDSRLTVPLTVENFNSFRSGQNDNGDPFENSLISILSTAYDLQIKDYARVEVGFEEDSKTGDTSNINHQLDVVTDTLVVSDYRGDARTVTVDRDSEFKFSVSGLTDQPILYNSDIKNVTLWGAELGGNHFMVEENGARLTMYGGLASDTFDIGGANKQDLDLLTGRVINVVGGEGMDRINVFDSNSNGKNSYRMRDRWVFHAPDSRGVASRDFAGLWYVQADRVDVHGNDDPNIFRITPSEDVSYKAFGAGVDSGDGDKLLLVGVVPDHQLIFTASTYYFGQAAEGVPKPIRYSGIEQVSERGIVAVANTAGVAPPVVEIYDEWNRRKINSIQPYNSGYLGGVSVATGYVLPGATPSVVTAPTNNGFGSVRVFDAVTGEQQHEFKAFSLSHGGFDVAVGNVLGDSRYEIIVSQLTSNSSNFQNEFEVWEQVVVDGETTWSLNRTVSPFANAPEVGTRISVNGDFNFDGYDDIVAGAGPGWLPQVAIYEVNGETKQLHRFLAHDRTYQGGIFVAASNLIGNRKSDVVVSFAPTNGNPAPNVINTFRGERLLRNSGGTVLAPDRQDTPFGGDQATAVVIFDANFDQRADQIFAANSGTNLSGVVKVLNNNFSQIDSFFAGDDFLNGAELG